jgi:diguanylate cyclase
MIWQFDGEMISLLIVVALLYDIFINKHPDDSRRENLFRNLVATSAVALSVGVLNTIFNPGNIHIPLWVSNALRTLHLFTFPLIQLIWIHFTLRTLHVDERRFHICMIFGDILLGIFSFMLLLDYIFGGFFVFNNENTPIGGPGFIWLIILCILYAGLGLILVIRNFNRLEHNKANIFILVPIMFILSSLVFYFIGNHGPYSITISISILLNYLIIQNRKLTYDSLTGLPNRKVFLQNLEKTLVRNIHGYVLLADIENFKYFNHHFGQVNGDTLLVQLGEFFVTIAPNHTVYRIGGDQFAMIIQNMNKEDIQQYVQSLEQRFLLPWNIGEAQSLVKMHYALVSFPTQARTRDQILHAIDFTLSEAKIHRNNNIAFYDTKAMQKQERNQEIKEALRKSIQSCSLMVHYQPVFDLRTNQVVGAEALSRLHDPTLGNIAPSEFIPIAEESGLIIEMTYLVIQRACDFRKQVSTLFPDFKHVAINLSSVNFMQPSMEKDILNKIHANQEDPSGFIFELTESILVESFDRVNQIISSLALQGFTFALDDYGTGYSNIEYLMRLPFQTVKLDRSIIEHCDSHRELLESIVLMLHKIGKTIVAEGVETERQLLVMRELGVDQVQGYLLGRPMSEKEDFWNLAQS